MGICVLQTTAKTPNQGTSLNVSFYTFGSGQGMGASGSQWEWREAGTSEHQQRLRFGPGGQEQGPLPHLAPAGPWHSAPGCKVEGWVLRVQVMIWNLCTPELNVPCGSTTSTFLTGISRPRGGLCKHHTLCPNVRVNTGSQVSQILMQWSPEVYSCLFDHMYSPWM